MGDETQAGAGAAPAGEGGAAAPVDPNAALMQRLDALVQRSEAQERVIAQLAARGAAPQQQEQPGEQDDDYVDPAVQKHLAAYEKRMQGTVQAVQDQNDQMAFDQHVNRIGIPPEVVQQAQHVFDTWRSRGIKIGDNLPSRFDALRYTAGVLAEQGKLKPFGAGAAAMDQQTQDENRHATVERSGRGRAPVPPPASPDSVSRQERLKDGGDYWAKRLDSEPW